jgi:hypothetical protein
MSLIFVLLATQQDGTFFTVIVIVLVITFMQDIYNYIPETNHISSVYSVAAVL